MTTLKIDPEFQSLIPPLTSEERAQLETTLQSEGCSHAITTWNRTILDGHNRYEICTRLGIGFDIDEKPFADRDAAKEWIIRNQFGRRNINAAVRAELALTLKGLIAARAKENQKLSDGRGQKGLQNSANLIEPVNTREELAKLAGVSRDTIAKMETIMEQAPPELKDKVRSGEVSINKAHNQIKAPHTDETERQPAFNEGKTTKLDRHEDRHRRAKMNLAIGNELAMQALIILGRILPQDKERGEALAKVRDYCTNRLEQNK